MKKGKAIFLGKFQPPHLGHIQTIFSIAKEYDELIVGITCGEPKVLEYSTVKNILEDVCSISPKISVHIVKGVVEEGTAELEHLDFDFIVSGNRKVLSLLEKKGYKTKFQERSVGIGYSGTEIRNLLKSSGHNISLDKKNIDLQVELIPTSLLKPLERILPMHFRNIEDMINKDGIMKKPIIIDDKNNIVLDGSHRYAFLIKYGYKLAPVIKVDYEDDAIFVGNHLKHRYLKDEEFRISKSEVISRGVNENLFPARTTRHFFPFRKVDMPVELEELEKGEIKDISYIFEKISVDGEIRKDLGYIEEIDEELEVIKSYIEEQNEVKNYLTTQIEKMKVNQNEK